MALLLDAVRNIASVRLLDVAFGPAPRIRLASGRLTAREDEARRPRPFAEGDGDSHAGQ